MNQQTNRKIKRMMLRSYILILITAIGCIQPTIGVVPPGPSDPKKPTASEIERLSFEASQQRDAIGAKLLGELADEIKSKGEAKDIVHDKWVMDQITAANTEAAKRAGTKLATELGKTLNSGDKLDVGKAEQAVRGLAAGKLRASR